MPRLALIPFLLLSWSLAIAQSSPNSSAGTPKTTVSDREMRLTLLMWEIVQRQKTLNDEHDLQFREVQQRAEAAEARLAEIESSVDQRLAGLQVANAELQRQMVSLEQGAKDLQKSERKKRWRWLLYGLIIGGVAGAVAAQ